MYPLFFFNDTATTEIYTLSLHDALPIYYLLDREWGRRRAHLRKTLRQARVDPQDRKSTRLNSSHGYISYAVFCLKKKKLLAPLQDEGEKQKHGRGDEASYHVVTALTRHS